jgi:GTP-binding protein
LDIYPKQSKDKVKKMANIVAIVGRPNVGKSTLFNRLTESRKAIVDEFSGVTRDRHYGKAEWTDKEFIVIDTGGYVTSSEDNFDTEIKKQVILALEECSVILFMVDVSTGITDLDQDMVDVLRKINKPKFLVANKVDTPNKIADASEFYGLGMGEVYSISAVNGSGTGDLLDEVVAKLDVSFTDETEGLPKISVVGRPNVGKSSIVNAFLNQERNIVTNISGTTRDSIHTRYNAFNHDFLLIDTAGVRRKNKVKDLEFYSVLRTFRAIDESDVCILMIDATLGVESQDINIFQLIQNSKKGIVIVVNKWDLIEDKDSNTINEYTRKIQEKISPFVDVPIVFTSAVSKQRILKSLELALEVYENKAQKIPTSKLNEVMLPAIAAYPAPSHRGKFIKIKYVTQLPTHTPSFAFFCNHPNHVKDPYKRYLENKLRDSFHLTGVPINIFMRQK